MLPWPDKDPLPVNRLASKLDKDIATIYRWGSPRGVRGHRLRLTRIGGRTYVFRKDWEAFQRALNKDQGPEPQVIAEATPDEEARLSAVAPITVLTSTSITTTPSAGILTETELSGEPPPRDSWGAIPNNDTKRISRSLDQAMVISGDNVVGYNGSGTTDCPYLEQLLNYVSFNGNGVRRGCGYKLRTCMDRAGYGDEELLPFLDDLSCVSAKLGLIVAAIGKRPDYWRPLSRIAALARTNGPGRRKLDGLHLRVYAKADCLDRWNRLFQWHSAPGTAIQGDETSDVTNAVKNLREAIHAGELLQQQVAARLNVSKQYLSAVLKGKKRCSAELKKRIAKCLATHTKSSPDSATGPVAKPEFELAKTHVTKGSATMQRAALRYHDRGLCVIPIRSWEVSRRPYVKWKQYQTTRPTRQQVIDWWTKWPDAGIAAILGPVSGLLCVDVDGENAYRILLDLVEEIPVAPTCKSGGADPFRFHVYFDCVLVLIERKLFCKQSFRWMESTERSKPWIGVFRCAMRN